LSVTVESPTRMILILASSADAARTSETTARNKKKVDFTWHQLTRRGGEGNCDLLQMILKFRRR